MEPDEIRVSSQETLEKLFSLLDLKWENTNSFINDILDAIVKKNEEKTIAEDEKASLQENISDLEASIALYKSKFDGVKPAYENFKNIIVADSFWQSVLGDVSQNLDNLIFEVAKYETQTLPVVEDLKQAIIQKSEQIEELEKTIAELTNKKEQELAKQTSLRAFYNLAIERKFEKVMELRDLLDHYEFEQSVIKILVAEFVSYPETLFDFYKVVIEPSKTPTNEVINPNETFLELNPEAKEEKPSIEEKEVITPDISDSDLGNKSNGQGESESDDNNFEKVKKLLVDYNKELLDIEFFKKELCKISFDNLKLVVEQSKNTRINIPIVHIISMAKILKETVNAKGGNNEELEKTNKLLKTIEAISPLLNLQKSNYLLYLFENNIKEFYKIVNNAIENGGYFDRDVFEKDKNSDNFEDKLQQAHLTECVTALKDEMAKVADEKITGILEKIISQFKGTFDESQPYQLVVNGVTVSIFRVKENIRLLVALSELPKTDERYIDINDTKNLMIALTFGYYGSKEQNEVLNGGGINNEEELEVIGSEGEAMHL